LLVVGASALGHHLFPAEFGPAPCDPDGYVRDLLETARLEQHLATP